MRTKSDKATLYGLNKIAVIPQPQKFSRRFGSIAGLPCSLDHELVQVDSAFSYDGFVRKEIQQRRAMG